MMPSALTRAERNGLAERVHARLQARGLLPIVWRQAAAHHVTVEDICGPERTATVARARVACWLELRGLRFSYPEIGALFERDNSTVMAALKKARAA